MERATDDNSFAFPHQKHTQKFVMNSKAVRHVYYASRSCVDQHELALSQKQ